ncbi:unnamed protein product [Schistocephalus solidus]|uniref:C2H2-type domain-containing protein n=1 Tax=Schistocephalus solidus TaxID=70667 RepID=A0A183T3F8_SCHSO|nr:unnamed protein product [Schistocephalus solidus]
MSQVSHYKDKLKTSLKQMQFNPANWAVLAENDRAWRVAVKTGSAIYEDNRIATTKAKNTALSITVTKIIGNTSPTPTTQETTFNCPPPTISTTTIAPITNDGDSVPSCLHCDCTFTSRIALVGYKRLHRTQTSKSLSLKPTHNRDRRLDCPQYPWTFPHHMGLLGHFCINESGIQRNIESTDTPRKYAAPNILTISIIITTTTTTTNATSTNNNAPAPPTPPLTHPHCNRNLNSRQIDHLRIHYTEIGKLGLGPLSYSHRTRLHCSHCSRTLIHHVDLLGRMCLHNDLQ